MGGKFPANLLRCYVRQTFWKGWQRIFDPVWSVHSSEGLRPAGSRLGDAGRKYFILCIRQHRIIVHESLSQNIGGITHIKGSLASDPNYGAGPVSAHLGAHQTNVSRTEMIRMMRYWLDLTQV